MADCALFFAADFHVPEFGRLVERSEPHAARPQAEVYGIQRRYGSPIHGYADTPRTGVVVQHDMTPLARFLKRGWATLGADPYAFSSINVENSIVVSLLGSCICRKVGVIEMRGIAIREDDHQRTL